MTPEQILANFFVFDNFTLHADGAEMEFVSERLRGEVARFANDLRIRFFSVNE